MSGELDAARHEAAELNLAALREANDRVRALEAELYVLRIQHRDADAQATKYQLELAAEQRAHARTQSWLDEFQGVAATSQMRWALAIPKIRRRMTELRIYGVAWHQQADAFLEDLNMLHSMLALMRNVLAVLDDDFQQGRFNATIMLSARALVNKFDELFPNAEEDEELEASGG